ncbi:MAG TPA: 3-hydroxyacyl-CoA dehydrogenase family protein [Acidimicrobiales bacterium]|nr:3-hydroxyacyl-CoA dehydrogenase family protein [Acidimicrobiales bacterium]
MAEGPLRRIGIIGGGTMGAGIAYAAARAGVAVRLAEADAAAAGALASRVASDLDRDLARGLIDETGRAATLALIEVVASVAELGGALDLVVEAVPERLELKHLVLAEAEALAPRLLASNTSSISIDALAEALARPERLVGMHFFNPVRQMALVEVVVGTASDPGVVGAASAAATQLGKEALVVHDAPGFLTSRLGVLLGLEAIRMLESGLAAAEDIDRAMVLGYGHPMGPLRLTDLVGLDVRLGIARVLEEAYGPRFSPPPLLERLVAEGRLGRKAGRGFYDWPEPPAG